MGGIEIAHDRSLVGHSDADALLHAVTDALLGAAAQGDIGELFPNTDQENRDRASADMLRIAYAKVQAAGFRIVNLDAVIHAQRPKLSAYKQTMIERIADILQIKPNQVGLKAKTGEGVGTVGREESIEVRCVALLINEEAQNIQPEA